MKWEKLEKVKCGLWSDDLTPWEKTLIIESALKKNNDQLSKHRKAHFFICKITFQSFCYLNLQINTRS